MEDEILTENDIPTEAEVVPIQEETVPAEDQVPAPEETDPAAEETETIEAEEPPAEQETTQPEEMPEPEDDRTDRRIRRKQYFRGALKFYSLLLGGILCVLILLWCLMNPLKTLLTQYETAQPQYVAEEIFAFLFADPDWSALHDMAGVEATLYEGRREYVAYMEEKVGDRSLHYVEVPSGSSDEKRYSVRLGDEQVAAFTMVRVDDGVSTFDRWAYSDVEVFFTREESVTVNKLPGHTVYVNSLPLDDSYTTLRVDTLAEDYLPEGLHGYRYEQQTIGGFLVSPEVVVLDEYNNPVEVTQDPETGIYSAVVVEVDPMTWGESELIFSTVQAQALFSIQALTATQLREYFPPSSQAYQTVTSGELLDKDWKSYQFDETATEIRGFYRYSDKLFSVWAQVTLIVTDKDGNVGSHTFGGTFFFRPNALGSFVPDELYELDLLQLRTEYLNQ